MPSTLNEESLEALIESHLVGANGYVKGDPADYDRSLCLDVQQLMGFLEDTQPEVVKKLSIGEDGQPRAKFLARLASEIRKRGVVDVLRSGFGHQAVQKIRLFYPTPSAHNDEAARKHGLNRWVITRQLRYSRDEEARSLDMAIFINGLPVVTFELKNSLTRQSTKDAIRQYQRDRPASEPLFKFGVCLVHFAVDDQTVAFRTALADERSVFLPFNKGWNEGAGNPPKALSEEFVPGETLTLEQIQNQPTSKARGQTTVRQWCRRIWISRGLWLMPPHLLQQPPFSRSQATISELTGGRYRNKKELPQNDGLYRAKAPWLNERQDKSSISLTAEGRKALSDIAPDGFPWAIVSADFE